MFLSFSLVPSKHQIFPAAALPSRDICQFPKFAAAVEIGFTLGLTILARTYAKNVCGGSS